MVEHGEVIKAEKGKIVIDFERKTACDKCGMCAFNKDDMKVKLTLKNEVGAKVGDVVEVTMGDKFVLASAFIVYLIPIVLIGILLAVGIYCNLEEYIQIILCVVGFVVGFIISAIIDKFLKKRKNFSPSVTKILYNINDIKTEKNEDISNEIDITKE